MVWFERRKRNKERRDKRLKNIKKAFEEKRIESSLDRRHKSNYHSLKKRHKNFLQCSSAQNFHSSCFTDDISFDSPLAFLKNFRHTAAQKSNRIGRPQKLWQPALNSHEREIIYDFLIYLQR